MISATWLAHVVPGPTDTAASPASPPRRENWYPLHQLARWSGVVAADAPPPIIKQAMAQAKATIDAHCKRSHISLDDVYRKLGTTVCISEQGFRWSVRGWVTLHPHNAQLRRFNEQIETTMQAVFQSKGEEHAVPAMDAESLRRKFAFDATDDADDDDTLLSASLAAPASQFSLAAFLDQHLQPQPQAQGQVRSAVEQAAADMEALAATRSELQQLQALWVEEQRSAAGTNPALVAEASLSLEGYHAEMTRLSAEHASIQARLASHLATSAPMRKSITTLQRNMQFIQLVQLYESLLRQATDLSERCKEALSGHVDPAHPLATEPELSAAAVDHNNVHSICTSFLKLMRIYQGLHETTAGMDNPGQIASEEKKQPATPEAWVGVRNLQTMVRTRILTILAPLHRKLIQLYQQTLANLHWPQTSHTLLLGLHVMPAMPAAAAASSSDVSPAPSSVSIPSSVDSSLSLFELLTENLVRIQMMLEECGMSDEIRRIEREIEGPAGGMGARDRRESAAGSEHDADRRRGASASPPPSRLWVLSLLLQPIYKRFYFHFDSTPPIVATSVDLAAGGDAAAAGSGSSSDPSAVSSVSVPSSVPSGASLTNRLDKPEWVLTFLEKIFTDHKDFLAARVQPIVTRCHFQAQGATQTTSALGGQQQQGVRFYEFNMEFLEALLGFYHAKLSRPSVQQAILSSPSLLRHTLDEIASFEAKLEALYGYPIHSSRRLSLTDAFLRSPRAFAGILKAERDAVNKSLDALREQPNPWGLVHRQHRAIKMEGESSSDEEDEPAAASVDPSLDSDESLTLASSSATNSSHAFLSLLSRITLHAHGIKYLNLRLRLLKDLQFKLFEIYEEDLIREFQANWKRIQSNARAGGLQYLMIPRRKRATDAAGARSGRAPHQKLNAFSSWAVHCGLLNSIDSILEVLAQHWNEESYFLELYYFYTHRTRILKDFSAAAAQANGTQGAAANDKEASAVSSSERKEESHASGPDEDEVLITSEEMALWMANGGQAPFTANSNTAVAAAEPIAQTAHAGSDASVPTPDTRSSYLPAGFQRTLDQLSVLSKLSSMELNSAAGVSSSGLLDSDLRGSSAVSARLPVLTPTSDSLFPKLSAVELRLGAGGANRGARGEGAGLGSGVPPPLPADLSLSGTLFEPILASYSSLREEMLHSLVGLVVAHFREGIRASGYSARGHLGSDPHASRLGGLGPFAHADLDHFVSSCASLASSGVTPASQADWALLEHHVEISRELAAPLMELKMQLMVGHHCLASSLHRSFWTAIAAKLQSVCFEDLVVGQYFTCRAGSLQFVRDMRALILLFAPYQSAHTLGAGISTHFKLVQDTINLLLLSSRQRAALLLDLTEGPLASSSPAVIKQHLARPPYQLQRINMKQVVELLQHVREEADQDDEQGEEEAQEADAEVEAEAEAEAEEDEQGVEQTEADFDADDTADADAAPSASAAPLSPFEVDEPELESLEDLSPSHRAQAEQADEQAADLYAAQHQGEFEDDEHDVELEAEQEEADQELEAADQGGAEQIWDEEVAATEEAAEGEDNDAAPEEDENEDEDAEPVDFLAAAAARALASASAAAPAAHTEAPEEEAEPDLNLDDFGGFPDEPTEADDGGVAP